MKLSVVTPSLNQLKWLKLCVASVADQTAISGRRDLNLNPQGSLLVEHIVQDAGTKEIQSLTDEARFCSYVRKVICEEDDGMYDALNRGFGKATGAICAWLNCDEQYLPGTLSKVAQYFTAHPEVEVLFGDAILVDAEGQALSYRRAVLPTRLHTRLLHLNTLSCATFFRRSLFERGFLFGTEWRSIGDAVWVNDLLESKAKMAVLAEPLAIFTFTGWNLSEANKGPGSEHDHWRRRPGAPPVWLAKVVSVAHRFRKFAAGSYRRRSVSYQIYTAASQDSRKHFEASNLAFSWPHGAP
jgi:glycosyltransferase involved in cell wall biosynthesis